MSLRESPTPSAFTGEDVLEALPSAAVILDGEGRLIAANQQWTRFSIDHDDFLVALRPGDDFLELCIDHRRPIESGVRAVLAGTSPRFSIVYPSRSADGDRWIRVEATRLGEGALVTHTDVGDEYAHLGHWLADGIEGVVELNDRLEPTYVSQAWLAGSDRQVWTAPLDEDGVTELWERLRRCLVDHETFAIVVPGGRRWFRLAASTEVGADGTVRRVVIMISDVTQQRRTIELAAAEGERSRVAAHLHDTAVQRLYGTALALQRLVGDGGADRGTIEDTIARLDRTIGDLRALGRADEPTVESMAGAWATVLADATTALDFAPRVKVDALLDDIPPATATHLLAVLTESLSNVARHAGATTCVVQLEARGDMLVLTVADNGCGMPADRSRSSGTRNISQRAETLGGRAMWSPATSGGTMLTWQVPMGRDAEAEPAARTR